MVVGCVGDQEREFERIERMRRRIAEEEEEEEERMS